MDKVIQDIITLAKNDLDVEVLWLYGSRARNTANQVSDYDLAIAFKSYVADPIESRLRPELLAIKWQNKLQVALSILDINLASLPLAYTVVQDNHPLYFENNLRRMDEERIIMSKWEVDYLYHRKHYAKHLC